MHWYTDVLKKYALFEGRATRTEYWMFTLYNFIIGFIIGFVEGSVGLPAIVSTLYMLAIVVPSLAVAARRLHDTNRSGWWLLLAIIPLIGGLVLLYFMVQDSTPETNRFGINPKSVVPEDASLTSVHQSEPEIAETQKVADNGVVINDIQTDSPAESATSTDSSGDSSGDSSSSS